MEKTTICIHKNKDADQLDQRLCFRYTDSTIPLLSKKKKKQASSRTARFVSGTLLVYLTSRLINQIISFDHNKTFTSGKHVRAMYTPYTQLLYSKTGVCRGKTTCIFLMSAPNIEHRLLVLVSVYPQSMF